MKKSGERVIDFYEEMPSVDHIMMSQVLKSEEITYLDEEMQKEEFTWTIFQNKQMYEQNVAYIIMIGGTCRPMFRQVEQSVSSNFVMKVRLG